jgi:hypothetical protein
MDLNPPSVTTSIDIGGNSKEKRQQASDLPERAAVCLFRQDPESSSSTDGSSDDDIIKQHITTQSSHLCQPNISMILIPHINERKLFKHHVNASIPITLESERSIGSIYVSIVLW